jgi:hypothetical protein
MKNKLPVIIALLVSFFIFQSESQAQSKKLIHYWHFNNTISGAHLGSIPADYSTLGNASVIYKPVHGGGSDTLQSYIDNLAGDTINQRPGFGGCCGVANYAVRTRNPSDNMQFLWYIPTKKYQNIIIKYETQSSSTASGQHRQVFSYSIDSAMTFTTAGLPIAYDSAGIAWGKVRLDLSSIPAVNNTGKLVLRMKFTAPNTGTSGNNRFDNITVEGDTIIRPSFTSTALISGIINTPYSYTITTTGTPVPTISVTGNPSWLTLNNNVLSGTPTSVATFGPITVTATNSGGSSQQIFNLSIGNPVTTSAPTITSIAPTNGKAGTTYSYKITSTGIPKPAISVAGNPQWLLLTDTTLTGVPPSFGLFGPITITATNILGSSQQTFSITVPSAPLITSTAVTTGVADSPYTYSIASSGMPIPDLSISGNPSWMTLNGNSLNGTPLSVGTFGPITITASNSEGSVQQTFNVVVSSSPRITSTALTAGTAGSLYSYSITSTGTPAPLFTVSGNPAWLTLNGNTLSGTPTSTGLIGPLTLTATNIVSADKQTFYINVTYPPINTSITKLIHYWHFNNTLPADGSGNVFLGSKPIKSDYSWFGNGEIEYKSMQGVVRDTGQVDNLVGDTINQRAGYGGCCNTVNNAIRTRNPSDSMQFLWHIPTSRYKNIIIQYETQLSSIKSGQREQIFSYSTDNGATFSNTGLPVISNFADTVWKRVIVDLRSIAVINNNSKFVFRIKFSAPNTGNKGNNRFDNITVEGDVSSDIEGVHDINNSYYIIYPNPAKDHINLVSTFEGEKIISIYNSTGMMISTYNLSGKEIHIDTSLLSNGLYFVKITETKGINVSILKFIKE